MGLGATGAGGRSTSSEKHGLLFYPFIGPLSFETPQLPKSGKTILQTRPAKEALQYARRRCFYGPDSMIGYGERCVVAINP